MTDAKGIVEVIMLLPGQRAARVRRQAAELLCRYLGGDLALVDEVCRIRGFQEQLTVQAPQDSRHIFGEAAEAAGGHSEPWPAQGGWPAVASSCGAKGAWQNHHKLRRKGKPCVENVIPFVF